jgi:hypothetical protein
MLFVVGQNAVILCYTQWYIQESLGLKGRIFASPVV